MPGRRSQRTYAVHAGSERWAFIPHPEISGWWFRSHVSVLIAACPVSGCGAEKGQPCKHNGNYVTWTHYPRREAAKRGAGELEFAHGIVMNIENPRRKVRR